MEKKRLTTQQLFYFSIFSYVVFNVMLFFSKFKIVLIDDESQITHYLIPILLLFSMLFCYSKLKENLKSYLETDDLAALPMLQIKCKKKILIFSILYPIAVVAFLFTHNYLYLLTDMAALGILICLYPVISKIKEQ